MVVGLIHSDCQWHNGCYSLQGSVETPIAALSETMVGAAVNFNLANAQGKSVRDASLWCIIVNSLSGNFSVDVYLNYTREVYHIGDRKLEFGWGLSCSVSDWYSQVLTLKSSYEFTSYHPSHCFNLMKPPAAPVHWQVRTTAQALPLHEIAFLFCFV